MGMGVRIRILVFGKERLSSRQINMLENYIMNQLGELVELEIIYKLGTIEQGYLDNVHPSERCPKIPDAVCIDYAVLEYDMPRVAIELLKKDIKVLGFKTMRALHNDGDILGGRVKTVGIFEYELSIKKTGEVAVD